MSILNAITAGAGGVALSGDTSGNLTIQSAGTNVATFNSTGLVMPSGTYMYAPGSVVQVVGATYSTQQSTSSNTFANSGLTTSITPKFSTSKIFILASFMAYVTSNKNLKTTITRGSTNLGDATYGMGTVYCSAAGIQGGFAISYLDSPATTSSTTYSLAYATENGPSYLFFNGEKASITLMEIAA